MKILEKIEKQTAEITSLAIQDVEDIVSHIWKSTHNALHSTSSVEVTGFGYFSLRPSILRKELKKFEEILSAYNKKINTTVPSSPEYKTLQLKILSAENMIEHLKSKQC